MNINSITLSETYDKSQPLRYFGHFISNILSAFDFIYRYTTLHAVQRYRYEGFEQTISPESKEMNITRSDQMSLKHQILFAKS